MERPAGVARGRRSSLWIMVVLSLVTLAAPARADTTTFAIDPQDLSSALKAFAVQSHREIFFEPALARGKMSHGVKGQFEDLKALTIILDGTGLSYSITASNAILVRDSTNKGDASQTAPAPSTSMLDESPNSRVSLAQAAQGSSSSDASGKADHNSQQSSPGLSEIVVTAQKRSERLIDVPLAVQAETAEELLLMGARSFADFAPTLAGVQIVESGTGRDQLFIRGVAAPQGYIGMESAIGVYLDDVPISEGQNQPDLNLYDVDRIEVLRGPQGTLYGSASLGGTIRIITNPPKLNIVEGTVETELSNTEHGGFNPAYSATLNMPIRADIAAIRAVVYGRNPSGFIDNPTLHDNDVNKENTYGGRIALRIEPMDQLTIDLKAIEQHTNQAAYNQVDTAAGTHLSLDQYRNIPEPFLDSSQIYNGTVSYQGSAAALYSSTSYSRRHRGIYDDFTGLNILGNDAITPSYQSYVAESFTEELRVSSVRSKPLSWLVGAYFNRTNDNFFQSVASEGAAALLGLPNDNLGLLYQTATDKQKALFGELGYSPIEALTLTAGVRVADLTLSSDSLRTGILFGGVLQDSGETTQHANAPKLNLSFRLTPEMLTYVQAAKGYRIGGVNATIAPAGSAGGFVFPKSYGPDSLWSYEAGLKGGVLDRRLNFDVDVFYIDWKNIQVDLQTAGYDYFTNAGNAVSKGAEAQGDFRIIPPLQIGGQISYTNSRLTTITPQVGNTGDRVPFVPQLAASVFLSYGQDVPAGHAYVRLDVQHVGTAYTGFGEFQAGNFSYGAYTLTNLKIGLDLKSWRFALFARNLFDQRASLFAQPYIAEVIGPATNESITIARPRTIGADATWRF